MSRVPFYITEKELSIMSRTSREKSISSDEQRKVYYLYLDFGKNRAGQRIRRYQTYPTLTAARQARDNFRQTRVQLAA